MRPSALRTRVPGPWLVELRGRPLLLPRPELSFSSSFSSSSRGSPWAHSWAPFPLGAALLLWAVPSGPVFSPAALRSPLSISSPFATSFGLLPHAALNGELAAPGMYVGIHLPPQVSSTVMYGRSPMVSCRGTAPCCCWCCGHWFLSPRCPHSCRELIRGCPQRWGPYLGRGLGLGTGGCSAPEKPPLTLDVCGCVLGSPLLSLCPLLCAGGFRVTSSPEGFRAPSVALHRPCREAVSVAAAARGRRGSHTAAVANMFVSFQLFTDKQGAG